MKKIYILTAVFALLTLSLNAQEGKLKTATDMRLKTSSKTVKDPKAQPSTFNELVRGIKGMSSVLQADQGNTANSGTNRAPLRLNSDEELMGPFTTYDTSVSGYTSYGWSTAYGNNYQQIYVFADLDRSAFEGHDGDDIVGYRFALGGNTSQTAVLYDFLAMPYDNQGQFDQTNSHIWSIPEVAGVNPAVGNISIEANNGYVAFKSITVYSGNTVITQWIGTTNTTNVPSGWTFESGSQFADNGDGSYYMTYGSSGGGLLTISSSLFTGYSNVRVVINAAIDAGSSNQNPAISVNGDTEALTNENPTFNNFEWTIEATTPTYMELAGGQWYEYYLDEPIPFNVASNIEGMYLGYRFFQYPSTMSGVLLNPVAINPNSNTAGILTNRYGQDGTATQIDDISITIPSQYTNIRSITVTSGNTTITSYSYANNSNVFPDGWSFGGTIGLRYDYSNEVSLYSSDGTGNITISGDLFQGYNSVTVSIYFSSSTRNQTATVNVNGTNRTTTSRTGTTQTWTVNATTVPVYSGGWWNENIAGDLAVQLIFKNSLPKTDPPTITMVNNGDGTVTITATATDPTADVNLDVNGQTASGTGTASITIAQGNTAQNVTATATAQEDGKLVSNPATENFTIPALPKTDTPSLNMVDNGDGTVTITATGNGSVTLTVDGYAPVTGNGTASVTIPQTDEVQTVTATATAIEQYHQQSDPATQNFTIPAIPKTDAPTITYTPGDVYYTVTATGNGTVTLNIAGQTASGEGSVSITVMRANVDQNVTATATAQETGKYESDPTTEVVPIPALTGTPPTVQEGLLRMHLLMVDQLMEEIPDDNSHPDRYGYVLKFEPQGGDTKESGTVEVDIEKTEATVNAFYTQQEVDDDVDRHLDPDMLNADVRMYLPGENPNVLYYEIQSARDANPAQNDDYITQLQYMKNIHKYEEMLESSPNKGQPYDANAYYRYFDETHVTGSYGNFMTYAPSVMTWGIDRRYFEEDGLNNTYGAPIWKSSVGQVRIISTEAQLQRGPYESTQWDGVGGPCSLVFLGLEAFGDLPSTEVSNIVYEPYMMRVWIQSPGNNLRGCTLIPEDTTRIEKPGEHWEGDGTCYGAEPVLIYQGLPENNHIVWDVYAPPSDNQPWGDRVQFGALDTGLDDLKVYVRFYYRSTGRGVSGNSKFMRGNRDGEDDPEIPSFNASEGDADPNVTTGIVDMWNYLNHGEVVSTTYVNVQGMQSDQPFDGINIVVTRYSDGTTTTMKVVR